MSIICNNEEVPADKNILLDKWNSKEIFGEEKAPKPDFCVFNNTAYALDLLKKHIEANSKIVFHTDVDMDGIGTTYIFKKTLEYIGSNNHILLINKDKVHGIQQKHVDYFKQRPVDLMIITDSSSNEIDTIKQFNCDVLVIDHHEMLHNDLLGYCTDGIHRYVIVNNTIDNKNFETDKLWLESINKSAFESLNEYKVNPDMSCGLVVYELLRIYCICFYKEKLLENLLLYQWAGVTLITDSIDTKNSRNQWYLDNTLFSQNTESTLKLILSLINKYKATLDKSFIEYSLAPLVNKTIRAGESSKALNCILNEPYNILDLKQYEEKQKDAIDKAFYANIIDPNTGIETKAKRVFDSETIIMDIGGLGIHHNYTGVIAGRLAGSNKRNSAIYTMTEAGKCKGSFRGVYNSVDYRKFFDDYADDIYAQGHPQAFGFELYKEQLVAIMSELKNIEPKEEQVEFITVGHFNENEYGKYHVGSLDELKKLGYVWKIATGNAKVKSVDEILLRVKACDVVLKETKGKLFIYDVLGTECKAFEALSNNYFNIYIEYTNEITMYIRN